MNQLLMAVGQSNSLRLDNSLISICGAGTLGGNLAQALARSGFRRLRIIDRDWVEEQNLADEPYSPRDIGTPKARTLTRTLYDLAQVQAEPLVVELTPANAVAHLTDSDLVVDAFDNSAGRQFVADACAALAVPCLHLSLAPGGSHGIVGWDGDEPFSAAPADRIVAAVCEMIVRFLIAGEKRH